MSRNFELLQKLGKAHDVLQPLPGESGGTPPAPPSLDSTAPELVPNPKLAPNAAPVAGPRLVAPLLPEQPNLEEITAAVQQIFLAPGANAPRVVVFTSTDAGTGCTWVCARVAEVLAGSIAGTVCLVDANLRRPGLHKEFGIDNQPGTSESLRQLDPIRAFAHATSRTNLYLVTAGSSGADVQAQIASDRMRLRMAELRSEFDFVLIDSSALGEGNDAIGLASAAEGVVLVLAAHASRRAAARKAVQELQAGSAKVLGAVLNRRTFPIPEQIYKRL